MSSPIEVLIAIQARSTSTRFPKKIYEKIGERRVLDHVIDRANSAAAHVNKYTAKLQIKCKVAVLHPSQDDELVSAFSSSKAIFIGGPEHDVLSRYVTAQKMTQADYVVRLTSDCPMIFDFIIAKHINACAFSTLPTSYTGKIDYMSNIDEQCRTVADGLDCEIVSARALSWLNENAITPFDREHVTTAIRRIRPDGYAQAACIMRLDTSDMKLSIDTPEDLLRVRQYYHTRESKTKVAEGLFGKLIYDL